MERIILLHARLYILYSLILNQHTGNFILITPTLLMRIFWLNEAKKLAQGHSELSVCSTITMHLCLPPKNYVLSTLPRMSKFSESFLGLVLRNLNKFLSGILCESKILLLKLNRLAQGKGVCVENSCVFGLAIVLLYLFGVKNEHLPAFSPCPLCSSDYCLTGTEDRVLAPDSKN